MGTNEMTLDNNSQSKPKPRKDRKVLSIWQTTVPLMIISFLLGSMAVYVRMSAFLSSKGLMSLDASASSSSSTRAATRREKRLERERKKRAAGKDESSLSCNCKENESLSIGGVTSAQETSLANKDSAGFFTDISDSNWRMTQENAQEWADINRRRALHLFPEGGSKDSKHYYGNAWEPEFTCPQERRVGGIGDGAKWVCDPHRILDASNKRYQEDKNKGKCLVYSIGSAGRFQFEDGLLSDELDNNCEIHVFDPKDFSRKIPEHLRENIHYHAWGIEADSRVREDTEDRFYTFRQTVELLGHVGRVVDIFKIDCEGCEWRTYSDWFEGGDEFIDLRQVLVEVHNSRHGANDFFLEMQQQNYVIFHKEPNVLASSGLIEYAFLKLEKSFFIDEEIK